ncbi:ABC1 family-domain-containing protein, partial [Blyttiomyces helicus]
LGQWASSRTDLFPPWVCSVLSKLQSDVSPHSLAQTRKAFRSEFGMDLEDVFYDFNETPIGVGSIAQVYTATLKPNPLVATSAPIRCAIKILHPGVEDKIKKDLAIMYMVTSLLNLLPGAQWLSLPEEVLMFGSMMTEQLDLRNEANNLDKFIINFRGQHRVSYPAPIEGLRRRTVLIERYLDGLPMEKFLSMGRSPFDTELADIALDSFLRMLILDNLVHADMHPGNIFVTFRGPSPDKGLASWIPFIEHTPGPIVDAATISDLASLSYPEWQRTMAQLRASGYTPHLVILDAGLVTHLSPTNLRNFLDLFHAITEFDGARVADLMVSRSRTPWTVIDLAGFRSEMDRFLTRIRVETLQLSRISVGDILALVFSMVRTHHIKIESDFANVGIGIMLLEGIGRRLFPEMDLLKEAVPILREAKRRRRHDGEELEEGLGALGSGPVYWKFWAYSNLRPVLRIGDEVFRQDLFEQAREFFPCD